MAAVRTDRWGEVGAIKFDYSGRHQILWDKIRGYARVDFGGKRAMYSVNDQSLARAYEKGADVTDARKKAEIIEEGHRWFINDTFWLNPLVSLFDPGVTRSIAEDEDGNRGLLISYSSGGVTPGDAYLWFTGPDAVPTAWKMWVSLVPIGGLHVTWEKWQELPGGAKVSTFHKGGVLEFGIDDLKAGKTLAEVESGPDPFGALFTTPTSTTVASSQPAN
jgi:hypothetical protein